MDKLLHVSSNPHDRDKTKTSDIMFDVIAALIPASVFGVYHFGYQAAILIFVTILTCVLTEVIYEMLLKRPITINDGSAIVTGLLLALNLPSTLPVWIAVLGGVFAILVVKQLFGGLGQNFMNPAMGARCFLLISFAGQMSTFVLDGVTSATPLEVMKSGGLVNVMDMFIGNINGCIGETSAIAIMIGALYLIWKNIIDIRIPAAYLLTFVIFTALFGSRGFDISYLIAQVCGGGLLLAAFFMATDYVTSPITGKGRILYGICLGILTGIFRGYGASAEGVSYAVIFSNLLVPLIDKISMPLSMAGKERQNG